MPVVLLFFVAVVAWRFRLRWLRACEVKEAIVKSALLMDEVKTLMFSLETGFNQLHPDERKKGAPAETVYSRLTAEYRNAVDIHNYTATGDVDTSTIWLSVAELTDRRDKYRGICVKFRTIHEEASQFSRLVLLEEIEDLKYQVQVTRNQIKISWAKLQIYVSEFPLRTKEYVVEEESRQLYRSLNHTGQFLESVEGFLEFTLRTNHTTMSEDVLRKVHTNYEEFLYRYAAIDEMISNLYQMVNQLIDAH